MLFRSITSQGQSELRLVSELIDHSSASWKEDVLNANFLLQDVQAILKIPLSTVNQEDVWAWNHERMGLFSVRSAYRMLIQTKKIREDWLDHRAAASNSSVVAKNWCSLWRVKVPSKVRVFAWRLMHNSLPSADVLHARNMMTQPGCQICNAMNDSWRHSLIDCNMARCVWTLVDEEITEHMMMNGNPDAKQWIFTMMETLDHRKFVEIGRAHV